MKILKSSSVFVLCFFAAFAACAWNNPGHMAVAGLAFDELSPTQQQKLAAIMRQHPGYVLITDSFPDGAPDDREVVMAAATWPDLAKRDPKHYHNNGYEENEPAVTAVHYSTNMHKGYHFIDTPLWVDDGLAPSTLPPVPKVNAVGVVNVLITQLHGSENDPARAYDFAWLLHLVGDLHQPLHAVTGVTHKYPKGDVGGNEVHIKGAQRNDADGESELHAY